MVLVSIMILNNNNIVFIYSIFQFVKSLILHSNSEFYLTDLYWKPFLFHVNDVLMQTTRILINFRNKLIKTYLENHKIPKEN